MSPRGFSQSKPQRRHQSGVALLEALIAMLIFAFGVLGLVGLQAAMTQAQTSSKFRADASGLVSDLFAVIQIDNVANLSRYTDAACPAHPPCADWLGKLQASLPYAEAQFTTNAAAGSVSVQVSWRQGDQGRNSFSSSMMWR